jgi:hypothetical protein
VSSQTQIQIGSEFVGYRLDAVIARGGMGVVYRAYDLRLKRSVALKLMVPELALDERFRERFSREAELAMSLEHPNVVPIHDAGDIDGRLYLAMRYVEGADLKALLHTEGALEPARALAICSRVANALDAAHAKGLVHRDVKPSNVLLDESEHVYLADFGLTRRLDEQARQAGEGRSVGTPAYLAPEQIEGGPVDGRTDIYALGCLLFECLTGEAPFPRGSRLAVAWAHLEEGPPNASERRPELPQAIDPVIRRAMAKEPEDRYATCSGLIGAAEDALGLRRSPPLLRRKALVLVFVVLAAAFVAVAVMTVLMTGGHAKQVAPLLAGYNTVARVDPMTNKVSAVIDVGASPTLAAAGGDSVWVFNEGDSTISEIDATTNAVVKTTPIPVRGVNASRYAGPVLAADAAAAWFINGSLGGEDDLPTLTMLLKGGRGTREYRLDVTPTGVAVGDGAVWVVGRGARDYQVLRIDASTGRTEARTRFSRPIDSIGVGYRAVWVVGSDDATLYRINPRTSKLDKRMVLGTSPASRPEMMPRGGDIWIRLAGGRGTTVHVYPPTWTSEQEFSCCLPEWGEDRGQLGALWWYTWQTGSLFRQEVANGAIRQIRITVTEPDANGPCLTSIAIGSRSLWLTAAPSPDGGLSCPPD